MSIWKKLFGKSEDKKPTLRPLDDTPADGRKANAGGGRKGKNTLYHKVPEGWETPKSPTVAKKLRIDAILVLAQYTGDDKPCDYDVEKMMLRKMTDRESFLVPITLEH